MVGSARTGGGEGFDLWTGEILPSSFFFFETISPFAFLIRTSLNGLNFGYSAVGFGSPRIWYERCAIYHLPSARVEQCV